MRGDPGLDGPSGQPGFDGSKGDSGLDGLPGVKGMFLHKLNIFQQHYNVVCFGINNGEASLIQIIHLSRHMYGNQL